jgi:hypothetical protein
MEEKDTLDVETPDTSNQEDKGGEKTFTQEQLDKILNDRLAREREKADKQTQERINKALEEAERKAKLTEEEREKEAKATRDRELAERENKITLRERTIEAKDLLIQEKLPTSLVRYVVELDEETTQLNVKELASEFNKAVESEVLARLKGETPKDFSKDKNKRDVKKTNSNSRVF